MPEQLGLDQLRRHCGAVYRHKCLIAAAAPVVHGPGDELLAGAGLPQNADARLGGRHAVDLGHHALHLGTLPHDVVPADAAPQRVVLDLEPHEAQRVLDGQQQLVRRNGLLEEIDGAKACGANRHVERRLTGNHDDRRGDSALAEIREHRKAVLARHHDVGEDDVEPFVPQQRQRADGVVADHRFVTRQPKGARQRRECRRVVVDHKYTRQRVDPCAVIRADRCERSCRGRARSPPGFFRRDRSRPTEQSRDRGRYRAASSCSTA